MNLLITGGAGFIGSAVVRLCINRGYSVLNVDCLTYASNLENLAMVSNNPNYTFEKVDIRDKNSLNFLFSKYEPDAVIHLAAESHVDRSIDNPLNFMETNFNGTYNMLEAARTYWNNKGRPESFRFQHISTDEVFGSLPFDRKILFAENTSYNPRSPYSASKASSDHLVNAWYYTYQLPVLITNCSNNYGPFHFPEKLIPVVIINALNNKPIEVYGDGRNVRDWIFVEDHVNALLMVLENGKVGRSYNIGGESELSNIELVQMICSSLDKLRPLESRYYSDLITFVADRPGHDARYAIDCSRIKKELGWKPSVSIIEGIEKTVKWYLDNKNWWEPLMKRKDVGIRLGKRT